MSYKALPLLLLAPLALPAQTRDPVDKFLTRMVEREGEFTRRLGTTAPLLETYIQELAGPTPPAPGAEVRDHYFLGRLNAAEGNRYVPLAARSQTRRGNRLLFLGRSETTFVPAGFAQMILIDGAGFNRANYHFEYVRREFLGDVRCLAFDVQPTDPKAAGRFIGRIWVDDQQAVIVRFNGTYTHGTPSHMYFHFDSWRLEVEPGVWIPALVYVEETNPPKNSTVPPFKAQTRLWGFQTMKPNKLDELTSVLIEAESKVNEQAAAEDSTPLENQRRWERQAEENILDRLEKGGLLAPPNEVDRVLDGVLGSLISSNNLNLEVRARVLLTTPFETFSVGRTIIISRGLIDVLPDEASLAMMLANELAHIALGHRTDTQFAFINQTMLTDEELLSRFRFARSEEQVQAAGKRALEILDRSPYKDKLSNAGLFLKALQAHAATYPNLLRSNMGNQLARGGTLTRLTEVAEHAPALEENRLEQIAALPLGSRIKLNPWTNQVSLLPNKPLALLSAQEKMPFEITPFVVHFVRPRPRGSK
jgi:hypothetical protein